VISCCSEIDGELRRFQQPRTPALDGRSWHIRRLLQCIHERTFDPKLNVNNLKRNCSVRDHNISSRFKHETGVSIKRYIEDLRLDAAEHLLQHGAFSAAEVAQCVGYEHLQTFYRAFTRRFDCTPGVARRRQPDIAGPILVPLDLPGAA
jgi:AraC-like DNA-binding protein